LPTIFSVAKFISRVEFISISGAEYISIAECFLIAEINSSTERVSCTEYI